ncbi:MAG: hypothetical protein R3B49_04535, partial [Phycisphaerales bacterium]
MRQGTHQATLLAITLAGLLGSCASDPHAADPAPEPPYVPLADEFAEARLVTQVNAFISSDRALGPLDSPARHNAVGNGPAGFVRATSRVFWAPTLCIASPPGTSVSLAMPDSPHAGKLYDL